MTTIPPPVQSTIDRANSKHAKWIRGVAIVWGVAMMLVVLLQLGKATLEALSGDAIYNSSYAQISATENYVDAIMGSVCIMVGLSPLFAIPICILVILKSTAKA